jgi:transcription initiation factor IIF auxiliary subunit
LDSLKLVQNLGEVHVIWLEGLGASYRIKGYFVFLADNQEEHKIEFDAVAFGGNYGGHNINVQISEASRNELMRTNSSTSEEVEELISEVQRKMLNNEMIVEFDKLKPENDGKDPLGNLEP